MSARPTPWSTEEVEATVAGYFRMLTLELAGQSYSKTSHRNALLRLLGDRSPAAVEMKHSNISAILLELGCPYIEGYKPRGNYQGLLFEAVAERVANDTTFNDIALDAVERPAVTAPDAASTAVFEDPPEVRMRAESEHRNYVRDRGAVKRDYIAREARNRALGLAGEEYVVSLERYRLIEAGTHRLADKVEHVSISRGDGLGYDVHSYETTGQPRLIEVKTTSFGKETPFYVSRGELEFSKSNAEQFQLYRLFDFRREPRLFALKGSIEGKCLLDAVSYMARFG